MSNNANQQGGMRPMGQNSPWGQQRPQMGPQQFPQGAQALPTTQPKPLAQGMGSGGPAPIDSPSLGGAQALPSIAKPGSGETPPYIGGQGSGAGDPISKPTLTGTPTLDTNPQTLNGPRIGGEPAWGTNDPRNNPPANTGGVPSFQNLQNQPQNYAAMAGQFDPRQYMREYQNPQQQGLELPQLPGYQAPQADAHQQTLGQVGGYQAPQYQQPQQAQFAQTGDFQSPTPQYQQPNLPQFSPSQQNMQASTYAQSFENKPIAQSNYSGQAWRGEDNQARQQLIDSITGNVNRNFSENILPQIKGGAFLNGGYGGAGAGIAEGLAASRLNQDISSGLANPLFSSYENAQNRNLQADMSGNALNAQNAQFNAGQSNNMLTSLLGLGNQATGQNQNFALGLGGLNNQVRGQDQSYALGSANANTAARTAEQNYALGLGGQGLQARGQDQSYSLGQANVNSQNQANANNFNLGLGAQGLTARGQDQGYNVSQANINTQDRANANNFALGLGSQGLTARGQDQSYNLGQGNLNLGGLQAQNSYNLGLGNLATGQYGADTSRMLGMGNLNLGQQSQGTNQFNADTSRMLGTGNLGLGQFNADTTRMLGQQGQNTNQYNADTQRQLGYGNLGLGLGNLGLNQDIATNNFYTAQRGQDLSQLGIGAQLLNQGQSGILGGLQGQYGAGQQVYNAPWNPLQQYTSVLGPLLGQGGSTTQTGPRPDNTMGYVSAAAMAAAMMMSDKRLKENINKIGKTNEGLPIYTYNYKGEQKTQMGVMAQEAEKKFPDAVAVHPSGYKMVNYGLLG